MRPIYSVRTLRPVVAGFFLFSLTVVAQTTQQPSLADAARANREQKKAGPPTGKVITNDSIRPVALASSGSSTPPSQPAGNAPADVAAPDSAQKPSATVGQSDLSPADQEKRKAEITSLRQQLKEEQGDVELEKHLVELDREAYFSEVDFAHDAQGKAKLDAEEASLKQKEEAFESLKAKLLRIAPQEALPAASLEQPKP